MKRYALLLLLLSFLLIGCGKNTKNEMVCIHSFEGAKITIWHECVQEVWLSTDDMVITEDGEQNDWNSDYASQGYLTHVVGPISILVEGDAPDIDLLVDDTLKGTISSTPYRDSVKSGKLDNRPRHCISFRAGSSRWNYFFRI